MEPHYQGTRQTARPSEQGSLISPSLLFFKQQQYNTYEAPILCCNGTPLALKRKWRTRGFMSYLHSYLGLTRCWSGSLLQARKVLIHGKSLTNRDWNVVTSSLCPLPLTFANYTLWLSNLLSVLKRKQWRTQTSFYPTGKCICCFYCCKGLHWVRHCIQWNEHVTFTAVTNHTSYPTSLLEQIPFQDFSFMLSPPFGWSRALGLQSPAYRLQPSQQVWLEFGSAVLLPSKGVIIILGH